MKPCKICGVLFTPKGKKLVTCGNQKCVRKNSGSYVKVGFVPIDHKGFENLVRRVRSSLSSKSIVTVIYIIDEGFKVIKSVNKTTEWLLESGNAISVGSYVKGVPTLDLIEDFVFTADQIASGELK